MLDEAPLLASPPLDSHGEAPSLALSLRDSYGHYRDIHGEAQPLAPPPLDSLGEAHALALLLWDSYGH